jgi:hypothetical protein
VRLGELESEAFGARLEKRARAAERKWMMRLRAEPVEKPKRPSPDEIERAKTPNGGWTRDQLAQWGVMWPPPSGWKKRLIAEWKKG